MRRALPLVVGLALALSACGGGPEPEPARTAPRITPTAPPTPATDGPPIVLVISVDGLNPDAITELGDQVPTFNRLISEGASTLDARNDADVTVTLPNHTGMITGRGMKGDDGHSVDFNGDNGKTLPDVHGSYVPSMFDVAHDQGVRTAMYASKPKFNFLMRSYDDEHGAADLVLPPDDGRDKIDEEGIESALTARDDVVDALIGDDAGLVFWHVPNPDSIGHAAGWMTAPYLQAVKDSDLVIGETLDLALNAGLGKRLTVLLTSDHGGPKGEKKHDEAELEANYTIPFIAWGAQVAEGVDLYDLNPERQDPGDERTTFSDPQQPVRNLDVADTALALLDLPPIDGALASSWPALRLR